MTSENTPDDQLLVKTQELLKSVEIPICPKYLLQLNVELREPNVNLEPIAEIIGHDVGLTARVLKIANSSLFGSRVEIDSITQALTRLGIRNFRNAVVAGALRQSIGNQATVLEKFWSHSEMVAMITQKLAQKLCPSVHDSAYFAGLFHDCGVPLLLKRFPQYESHLANALDYQLNSVSAEAQAFGTDHTAAGALLCRSWSLPQGVVECVRQHHGTDGTIVLRPDAQMLIAMVQLAERIEALLKLQIADLFSKDGPAVKAHILRDLQITDGLLNETMEEMKESLALN
jgi:putative nucleotidyltransferase with HDIG domain